MIKLNFGGVCYLGVWGEGRGYKRVLNAEQCTGGLPAERIRRMDGMWLIFETHSLQCVCACVREGTHTTVPSPDTWPLDISRDYRPNCCVCVWIAWENWCKCMFRCVVLMYCALTHVPLPLSDTASEDLFRAVSSLPGLHLGIPRGLCRSLRDEEWP